MRKRHPFLFGSSVLIGLLLVLAVVLKIGNQRQWKALNGGMIGVIDVQGVLMSSDSIVAQIHEMKDASSVKGVVLRVNSPGGGVVPSQEIYQALMELSERKPIYTSMASVAASGGYYIACGTNRIFANPGTITGSIGVVMEWYNIGKLGEKIGVKSMKLTSVANKSLINPFEELAPEKRKILQDMLNDTHQQFVAAVHQGRSQLPLAVVQKLADGRIFTGNQAQAVGLVDELASYEEVILRLGRSVGLSEPIQTVEFDPDEPKISNWFGASALLKQWASHLIPQAQSVSLQYLLD